MILGEFDQDTTQLVPDEVNLMSPRELSQYYIEDFQLKYYHPGGKFKFYFLFKKDCLLQGQAHLDQRVVFRFCSLRVRGEGLCHLTKMVGGVVLVFNTKYWFRYC